MLRHEGSHPTQARVFALENETPCQDQLPLGPASSWVKQCGMCKAFQTWDLWVHPTVETLTASTVRATLCDKPFETRSPVLIWKPAIPSGRAFHLGMVFLVLIPSTLFIRQQTTAKKKKKAKNSCLPPPSSSSSLPSSQNLLQEFYSP